MQISFKLPKNPEDFTVNNIVPNCPCFTKCITEEEVMKVVHKDKTSRKKIRECYDYNINCLLFYHHVEYARMIYQILDGLLKLHKPKYVEDWFFKEGEDLPEFSQELTRTFSNESSSDDSDDDEKSGHNRNEIPFFKNPTKSLCQPKYLKRPTNFIKLYKKLDQLYLENNIVKKSPGMFEPEKIIRDNILKGKCQCYESDLKMIRDANASGTPRLQELEIIRQVIRDAMLKKYVFLKRGMEVPDYIRELTSNKNYNRYVKNPVQQIS